MNPFEMQKQMYEQWEKNLGKYIEETMRQPEFMKLVGRNLEATLDLQATIKKNLRSTLKTLSIPTEQDLEGLYRSVNDLESRSLDIEEAVEDLRDELAANHEGTGSGDDRADKLAAEVAALRLEVARLKAASGRKAESKASTRAPAKKSAAKKPAAKASAKKAAAKKPAARRASAARAKKAARKPRAK